MFTFYYKNDRDYGKIYRRIQRVCLQRQRDGHGCRCHKPGIPEVTDPATGEVVKEAVEAVTWNYGAFCQNVLDFFIIAICLFFIVKAIAKASALRKKKEAEEAAAAPEPEPTKEEVLLTEIRDLLKEKK